MEILWQRANSAAQLRSKFAARRKLRDLLIIVLEDKAVKVLYRLWAINFVIPRNISSTSDSVLSIVRLA